LVISRPTTRDIIVRWLDPTEDEDTLAWPRECKDGRGPLDLSAGRYRDGDGESLAVGITCDDGYYGSNVSYLAKWRPTSLSGTQWNQKRMEVIKATPISGAERPTFVALVSGLAGASVALLWQTDSGDWKQRTVYESHGDLWLTNQNAFADTSGLPVVFLQIGVSSTLGMPPAEVTRLEMLRLQK
jgi:hypothetical protein